MSTFTINKKNSEIGFSIRHMRMSKVRGVFNSFSAKIGAPSITELAEGSIEVEIDVASISTRDTTRDQHLISADFFNADRFPKIYFKKTQLEKSEEDLFILEGELTIKDITKLVTFDVFHKETKKTDWGTEAHHFSCSTVINRKDFSLTYNALIEASGAIIDEHIQIIVELELNN